MGWVRGTHQRPVAGSWTNTGRHLCRRRALDAAGPGGSWGARRVVARRLAAAAAAARMEAEEGGWQNEGQRRMETGAGDRQWA